MKDARPLHVVFVISSLGRGGSERQMINLAGELNRRGHKAEIATLTNEGPLAVLARSRGIPVLDFGMQGGRFRGLLRLLRHIRRHEPDVVHPYLPRDNALVTLLKPFFRKSQLVWGVRSADMDWTKYRRFTSLFWKIVVFVSRWADLIIANSQFGADVHVEQGFPYSKIVVVPNGIDTSTFITPMAARSEERARIGVPEDAEVVGMLGRFDPMKGHDLVLEVFRAARAHRPNLHLVVVGLHTHEQGNTFLNQARAMGLLDNVTLLPESDSPEWALQLFDVLVLPSLSEAFPNVVAEALSCGVPVAAFDVGDVKQVVGVFGSVVPRGDVAALGRTIGTILDRHYDPADMHDYVENAFSISTLADRSLDAFRLLLNKSQGR